MEEKGLNDVEILNLVINNEKIQDIMNIEKMLGYWELVSRFNPEGKGYNWDSFKNIPMSDELRAVAYFKNEKQHSMFLVFNDGSWTSNTGQTGILGE